MKRLSDGRRRGRPSTILALLVALAACQQATPASRLSPDAPSAFAAAAVAKDQIRLGWGAAARATSYRLERTGGEDDDLTLTVTTTSYADTAVTPDTVYIYSLSAQNATGPSEAVYLAVATPPEFPGPVEGLSAEPVSDRETVVRWRYQSGVTSYLLERATGQGAFHTFDHLSGDALLQGAYLDTGLSPETSYRYRLSAQNASGSSAPMTAEVTTLSTPTSYPAEARQLTLENWPGGAGVAHFGDLASAPITPAGQLSYTLPTPDAALLEPITSLIDPQSGCRAAPSTARVLSLQASVRDANDQSLPFIIQTDDWDSWQLGNKQLLLWLYADKPVTLTGVCLGSSATLTLQAGWSALWRELVATSPDLVFRTSTGPSLPETFRWQVMSLYTGLIP